MSDESQVRVAGATPECESYVRTYERTEILPTAESRPTVRNAHRAYQDSQPIEPQDGWQPGDPIHENPRTAHQSGIFNFRLDSESETCSCGDAASWPKPGGRALPDGDELADFIAEYHEWRNAQAVAAVVIEEPVRPTPLWRAVIGVVALLAGWRRA